MDFKPLPFPLVDFHIHLVQPRKKPAKGVPAYRRPEYGEAKEQIHRRWSEDYDRPWRRAFNFPDPETDIPPLDEAIRRWQAEAARYNIAKLVFVTGGGNDRLSQVVQQDPATFAGFAHHYPGDPKAAADLERAVRQQGLKGLKIFAPLLDEPLASPLFRPLWEKAEELQIPVLVHFGILGGGGGIASGTNISPLSIEPVAKAYPGIPFVVPHFGCGYVRELLQLCWSSANVHVDTSGNNEWLRWYPESLTVEDLFRKFYETVGPGRIIFGSDSSYFPRGFALRYLLDQLRDCYHLAMKDEDLALIFGGNALRLLKEEGRSEEEKGEGEKQGQGDGKGGEDA